MLHEAPFEAQDIRASDFFSLISGHSLSERITPAHPLPFLAVYMRGKVVCATKKLPYGTPPV